MADTWTDRLSEYLDDELTSGERDTLESHLASCADCTRTLEELRRVVASAQALTPLPPATDLWDGIASRTHLRDSGASAQQAPSQRWKISFTLPQLVAASLLLAAVSSGIAWQLRPASPAPDQQAAASSAASFSPANDDAAMAGAVTPVSLADREYDTAVSDLEGALKDERPLLDPTTIAIVEQNLAIINVAIEQARQALEADPANGYLSSHLVEARRRKLELLRRAASMVAESQS